MAPFMPSWVQLAVTEGLNGLFNFLASEPAPEWPAGPIGTWVELGSIGRAYSQSGSSHLSCAASLQSTHVSYLLLQKCMKSTISVDVTAVPRMCNMASSHAKI